MFELKFGNISLKSDCPAFVMGIVNATPDSFYSGSRGGFDRAMELISHGADILDIGGESTRPGFTEVSEAEEIERVVPLIEKIRKESSVAISVDTRKSAVFREAFKAGCNVLNDVSSLTDDENMIYELKASEAGVILMHRWPEDTNHKGDSEKILNICQDFFDERITFLNKNNIECERIFVDPGIGFGKSFEENIQLIKNCDKLCRKKLPVVMALSRKRCIGEMTGRVVEERLTGTVTADIFSVLKGAKILRVHDVKETVDSLNVMKYLIK